MDQNDPVYDHLRIDHKKILEENANFDFKTKAWIEDEKEGFCLADIKESLGDYVVLRLKNGSERKMKRDELQHVNPMKFIMIEDMANLTYLNDASVLDNLRRRYSHNLIYVCFKIPIYTPQVASKYKGRRRSEMPPHIFSVADNAYCNMLQERENHGESGAGKTENTKRVISYFAIVAAPTNRQNTGKMEQGSLEEQIVQANPLLEAYGNAKTNRNNNSSRFGKFIRIHFGTNGKIAGADIEYYLLEKSRVNFQMKGERNYHIFYQILSKYAEKWHETLLVKSDPRIYSFINQGELEIEGVNESTEMALTDEAFNVLGFSYEEKMSLFKTTASILNMGEMKFKQRAREEQAEADGTTEAEKVAFLLGVNAKDLLNAVLRPKVKVGPDQVTKGQSHDQVIYAISALAKSLYSRMFSWLVQRVNKTLDTKVRRQYFIGVLDIAGFEIFPENSFEQICINYTNERLQQFFNHHMFVLEQEEYRKENIQWTFIDFGFDLQACIDLIEKPMGILSILEEECMFPKASDQTLKAKLYDNHLGKSPNFTRPKPLKAGQKEAHFELQHYAGTVPYNIDGWLDKNKDPINECVVNLLERSKELLVAQLFAIKNEDDCSGKRKKRGSFMTVSYVHRESLNKLMKNLHSTSPHFIRCIIPNNFKKPGVIDPSLVLHQLHCNGVLEGIRICRKGFPNRMAYSEFKQRYSILAPSEVIPKGFVDGKIVTEKILTAIQVDRALFQCGDTKVFFKAGTLAELEDQRDEKISKLISLFQAQIRGYIMRRKFNKLQDQRNALALIQRNIRKYLVLRTWSWWKLYTKLKPLLNVARQEEEMKRALDELAKLRVDYEKLEKLKKTIDEENISLLQQKRDLVLQIQTEQDNLADSQEKCAKMILHKAEMEQRLRELKEHIAEEQVQVMASTSERTKIFAEIDELKKDVEDLEASLQKAEQDKILKDGQIKRLQETLMERDEALDKLKVSKSQLDLAHKTCLDEVRAEQDKNECLTRLKAKLEGALAVVEGNLEREKKLRGDTDKAKRRLEQDLKLLQVSMNELDQVKCQMTENLAKKDSEISLSNAKFEEAENVIAQLQRKIKEFQAHIEELGGDLESEKLARLRIEKEKNLVEVELDNMTLKFQEQDDQSELQIEINKRREADLIKTKTELEEQKRKNEEKINELRKKHNDLINDYADQLQRANGIRAKFEKDFLQSKEICDGLNGQIESLNKKKLNSEKTARILEGQVGDLTQKCDDLQAKVKEMILEKTLTKNANEDLLQRINELEERLAHTSKEKVNLLSQIEETKLKAEQETRLRAKTLNDMKSLQGDLDYLRENLEEEQISKSEILKDFQRVMLELNSLKSRDNKNDIKMEELDEIKRRYNQRINELETENLEVKAKFGQLEKSRGRLQGELEDLMIEVEQANCTVNQLEKKHKSQDKIISEWSAKYQEAKTSTDEANKRCRDYSAEIFRYKTQIDEDNDLVGMLKREKKNLTDEICELTKQMSEGAHNTQETVKVNKRLEKEREELQVALEEAEKALESEEAKVQQANAEINRLKKEIDTRTFDKDEEIEKMRKNHQKIIESMQASLEAEVSRRNEVVRAKKISETDLNELESALESCSRQRSEFEKSCRKYQVQVNSLEIKIEDHERDRQDLKEKNQGLERKIHLLKSELEDMKLIVESAERSRKICQSEREEATEQLKEALEQNTYLNVSKKKLDAEINALQGTLDEAAIETRQAEERNKTLLADNAKLFEDVRQEQENILKVERVKNCMELKVKELEKRFEESEANFVKNNKMIIAKLEQKCCALEIDLSTERKRYSDVEKNFRKVDRKLKEVLTQTSEERISHDKLVELVNSLQNKLKLNKRQVEEAEELAAINLAKYRKIVHEVEKADERADKVENALSRIKTMSRQSSVARGISTPRMRLKSVGIEGNH